MSSVAATPDSTGSEESAERFGVGRERMPPLLVGTIVWLTSELMFFGGLFAAWFTLKANNEPTGNWPPPGQELDVPRMLVFSALLVSSSIPMHFAAKAAKEGRRRAAIVNLALVVVIGLVFLVNELLEWRGLAFGFSASAFSTMFYLLTGFHGAHVLAGLVLLTTTAWVVYSRGSRAPAGVSIHAAGYYWHFVDGVWLLLFLVVYVLL